MRLLSVLLVAAAGLAVAMPATGQSCVARRLPGPPLILDLSDVHGSAALGPDGVVREGGRMVLMPSPGSNMIDLNGRALDLPDRMERGVVWCAASIVAYPTSMRTIRLAHLETGLEREFTVPLDSVWGLTVMSDGSVWYRSRRSPAEGDDVEWHRLDLERGRDLVRTPTDAIVLDSYREKVLLAARERNPSGGRVARIMVLGDRGG